MKPLLKILIIIIPLIYFAGCCKQAGKQQNSNNRFITVIDSLQKVYAPDKRVVLWKAVKTDSAFTLLLDNEMAFKEVTAAIKKISPSFKTNIRLLPETNRNRLVSGLINNSVANLRTKPKHSAEMATQALLGTPVRVYKKMGEWYLVQTPNRYIAWVDSAALVTINPKELSHYKKIKKVVFKPVSGFSYSHPDNKSQTVSDLVAGCILPVTGSKNGFLKVIYPDGRVAWVKQNETAGFTEFTQQKLSTESLIKTAGQFLGFPYLWGGTSSKAVDCSGFTSTVYYMNGILLQRDASQQTKYGKVITTSYNSDNLLPGDLLFFGRPATQTKPERVTHVALYLGNGKFIHASGKVRINSMDSTMPDFIKSYVPRFVRAVRINGFIDGKGIEKLSNNRFYKEIIANN